MNYRSEETRILSGNSWCVVLNEVVAFEATTAVETTVIFRSGEKMLIPIDFDEFKEYFQRPNPRVEDRK